ncbi:hypothetical protein AB0R01_14720 [Streptomyces rochei]|uniref:hypothetical protein n=1 Tax=Streptomyces rochei TaxID=1928 RepID=UPI003419FA46
MPDTESPDRASGSVPHTYRLRLAFRWVPGMPRELRRRKAFLFALSTLASLADTAGRSRFNGKNEDQPGQPIRLTQLARAMGTDEKDARRYLAAAIAAGIVTTEQPPRRGRTTVYVLQLPMAPRWEAALAVLDAGRSDEDTVTHTPPVTEFGGPSPEPRDTPSSGVGSPNLGDAEQTRVRGTVPPWGSGDGSPLGSGDGSPDIPGLSTDLHHEMADVGPQVRAAREDEQHDRPDSVTDTMSLRVIPSRNSSHHERPMTDRQLPLLMPVQQPARPVEAPAPPPAGDHPDSALRDGWRGLVARLRPEDAAEVYRDRWRGEHSNHLSHPTGT